MRLTALCVCGTLLAFTSLSWTTAGSDEGDLLGDKGFGPCVATLIPEGPCRLGQDENMCPYIISLPTLTVHFPKQLREMEKIMKDLQELKDNVDQLKKICADCTVRQSERECARQRERESEHEKLNEGTDRLGDEKNWMNERDAERLKECGTNRAKLEKIEGDGDTDYESRTILEENERKKWQAEREEKGVVKENEKEGPLKEVAEKDGKIQTEWVKGQDKLGQTKLPAAGGKEIIVDMARERVVENSNRETDTDTKKIKDGKGFSKGEQKDNVDSGKERKMTINIKNKEEIPESNHYVRQNETKETENKTHNEKDENDKGGDGIKMSQEHDEHTNKEQEQHREEKIKEIEKLRQTENTGSAKKEIINEWEAQEEEDEEIGKEIETKKKVPVVQRDSDEDLASSKATETTDFVPISPAPQSAISLAARHDSMDLNEATTITPSLPSPPLSSFSSDLITDVNQSTIAAFKLPTQSTVATGISEHPSRSTTTRTLGGPGKQITNTTTRFISTTSIRTGADLQAQVGSTTTTSTPRHNLYSTTFPGGASHGLWTAKKNVSPNTRTGVKTLPGRGPKPGEKHKPGIKPEADQKPKRPKNDHKPDQAPLPDKKTKHDQKQKPSQQKPLTNQESKPAKDTNGVQISKPDQRARPDNLTTDQNLKNKKTPKNDRTPDQNLLPNQKLDSYQKPMPAVQRPTSQRSVTLNTTSSDKDPLITGQPESAEILVNNQNSKPEKNLHYPPKADKPDQKQKPEIKRKSEKKHKLNQKSELKQHFTPVQEPETETTDLTPQPKPGTELMTSYDENPSLKPKTKQNSTSGQKLTPDHAIIPLDQTPKPSQKIPKVNQKPKPELNQNHPVLVTDQKTKPNVKPKPGQTPQIKQGLKTPLPDQVPNLNPKSVHDESPRAESNKKAKPRPPPKHRPPTKPVLKPGVTSAQRPKPAVEPKPSSKTKTDLDFPLISVTTSNSIQNSQTDMPPTSGAVKQIADVTHSPQDTEFSPSTIKTITRGTKTYNTLETGSFPRHHSLPKGFTKSPNSRIMYDVKPRAGEPSSIPVTPRPNNIIRGISPGATQPNLASNTDSSLQAAIIHNVEEKVPRQISDSDKIMIPVLSLSTQSTSTVSPDFRSPNPANSGPQPTDGESSTPSARELRVKINQVAALLNNTLSLNGKPVDRHSKEHPKENQGGRRPDKTDTTLPTLTSSKVTMARRDCSDHLLRGETKSGVYLVTPDVRSRSFPVFCDMELAGGGWTLIQRRQDGSVSFNRTWAEYRSGFGRLDGGEFWLGNTMIHLLTRDRDMVLRVELEDLDGVMEHAQYEQFRVANERLRYRLTVGSYSGTAGDALRFSKIYDHNNRAFTTPDRDYDRYPSGNCGAYYSSGWWFDACMAANLNGRYYVDKYKGIRDGIFWGTWRNISKEYYPTNERQAFKAVRMMIRPKGFAP